MIKLHSVVHIQENGISKFAYILDLNKGHNDNHHAGLSLGSGDHGSHINTAADLIGHNIHRLSPTSKLVVVTGNYEKGKVTVKEVARFIAGEPTALGKVKTKRALAAVLHALENNKTNISIEKILHINKRKKLEKLREIKTKEILTVLQHEKEKVKTI